MQDSVQAPLSDRIAELGRRLKADGYRFHTPAPASHARVLARARAGADPLRDLFGWNRALDPAAVPAPYRDLLSDDELFAREADGRVRARLRFSSLGALLLAHSAFPTQAADAVFFGPDTYRFAHAIRAFHDRHPGFAPRACVDIGAGSGAGGLFCATLFPALSEIGLLDINPRALAFAAANAALNGIAAARPLHSDILSGWPGEAGLIICNPPYLVDAGLRAYRHGGGDWGHALAVRALEEALTRLSAAGHLLLYTGSPIVEGHDQFLEAAKPILESGTRKYRYEETDPDIFGEELDNAPYDQADRIAAVTLHVRGSDLVRKGA